MLETPGSVPAAVSAGTGVRDAASAALAAAVLCVGVAGATERSLASAAGVAAGFGIVGVAGRSVAVRPGRWSGPADRVTLARAVLIGGCATLGVLVVTGALPVRPWPLIALLVPALALDAVDGAVARRTGTSSAAGGRLDGELDAALLMVLSAVAVPSLGWWVLAIGSMRYAFYAAGLVRPRLSGTLAFSQFRRVVAALQGIAFAVGLAPVVPIAVAQTVLAAALVLLTVSFGRDVIHLERRGDVLPATTGGPTAGVRGGDESISALDDAALS